MTRVLPIAVALLLACATGRAWAELPPVLRDVRFDQHLNESVPLDLSFRDEGGRPVRLEEYFADGKPVVLVLAYYRCPMLCTQVLNGLVLAMLNLPLELGKDFQVVTVSFDPRETPAMAAAKKKTYMERYGRPGAELGWHFLTGEAENIRKLTSAVGFRDVYDERNDQFAHASGIVVLTPTGRISRYFYDIKYSPRDLRLGLVEASANKIGSPADQILLYCFHYDPAEGKYGVAIMNLVRLGGLLTLVGVVGLVGFLWRQERRKLRQRVPTAG